MHLTNKLVNSQYQWHTIRSILVRNLQVRMLAFNRLYYIKVSSSSQSNAAILAEIYNWHDS